MIIYGCFQKYGKTPKWLVKIMENLIEIDDLGVALFLETSILYIISYEVSLYSNRLFMKVDNLLASSIYQPSGRSRFLYIIYDF